MSTFTDIAQPQEEGASMRRAVSQNDFQTDALPTGRVERASTPHQAIEANVPSISTTACQPMDKFPNLSDPEQPAGFHEPDPNENLLILPDPGQSQAYMVQFTLKSGRTMDDLENMTSQKMKDAATDDDYITHMVCQGKTPPLTNIAPKLQSLELRETESSETLKSFSELTKLTKLHITDSEFSSEKYLKLLFKIPSVRELHITTCKLPVINVSQTKSKLEKLNLSFSSFSTRKKMPLDFGTKYKCLTHLDLTECKLKNLDFLAQLTGLEELILDGNKPGKELMKSINKLKSLTKLSMSSCGLSTIKFGENLYQRLKVLNLSANRLSNATMGSLTKLEALTKLDISGCLIEGITKEMTSLENLTDLNLSKNGLSFERTEFLGKLTGLTKLDISSCHLSNISKEMYLLSKLTTLNMDENAPSDEMFEVIWHLKALTTLTMSNCKILKIPDKLFYLWNLVYWDISNNRLERIQSEVCEMGQLKTLRCSGNPKLTMPPRKICEKSLESIQKWFEKESRQPDSEDESELSDGLEYLDPAKPDLIKISSKLRIKKCTKRRIQNLYYSKGVYPMTSPTRGRCLVINIYQSEYRKAREGSEHDTENIVYLFEALQFKVTCFSNPSAKAMERITKTETENAEHECYGMFVLVVMTHGDQTHLEGSDGKKIERAKLLNLLSAKEFPIMKGKPKLVIFQTCAGDSTDALPNHDEHCEGLYIDEPLLPNPSPHVDAPSTEWKYSMRDDFFILSASPDDFYSYRTTNNGSWFIRALVEAFYKHSCHRDIEKLFVTQVRRKVQRYCQNPGVPMQNPTIVSWPTENRKLYLFPGYNPSEEKAESPTSTLV